MPRYRVQHIAFFLILMVIACNAPDSKNAPQIIIPVVDEVDLIRKRHNSCILSIDTTQLNTNSFTKSQAAAYGYYFAYPSDNLFVEQKLNKELETDTISYCVSNDKAASFIIWLEILDFSDCGKNYTSDRYIINAVDKIDTLTAGMIRDSRIPKIGKLTVQQECKGSNRFGFTTAIAGEDEKYGYVYKFLSGQVPKSKIAIHYLFKYSKKKTAKYKPMGIYMANSLNGYPDQP